MARSAWAVAARLSPELAARCDPAELDGGIAYRTRFGFRGWVAGGAALGEGYGSPQFRVLIGARYVIPETAPRDPVEPSRTRITTAS